MKIVIALDSFKGSITAKEYTDIVAARLSEIFPTVETVKIPLADGGEGTLAAIAPDAETVILSVAGPLFDKVNAKYAVSGKRAFIEMAEASGLALIPYADGNALKTTTFGTGELIRNALERGCKEIFITVGGSATNDGGIGAMAALGVKFLDRFGEELSPVGENLGKIAEIDDSGLISRDGVKFTVLCDVNNPLVGEKGATRVFGKQKGAVGGFAILLENGMLSYAELLETKYNKTVKEVPKFGAAGGLTAALVIFLGAEAVGGAEAVLQANEFDERIKGADLIITGEGKLDSQSAYGKVVSAVSAHAKKAGVPVAAITGCAEEGLDLDALGLVYADTTSRKGMDVKEAMERTKELLVSAVDRMATARLTVLPVATPVNR